MKKKKDHLLLRFKQGMLLIELSFVIGAIVLFVGLMLACSKGRISHAQQEVVLHKLNYLAGIYQDYYLKHGHWPNNLTDLEGTSFLDQQEGVKIVRHDACVEFIVGDAQAMAYAKFE